jgi:hypothetical protein
MSDGWSLNKQLVPSDGPTAHPDLRMHLKLGDLDPCRVTHRDFRIPQLLAFERDGKGANQT